MKYVIVHYRFQGKAYYIPIIFPAEWTHADMQLLARRRAFRRHRAETGPGVVIGKTSAGFISFEPLRTYGESTSLGVKADPGDAEKIKQYIDTNNFISTTA